MSQRVTDGSDAAEARTQETRGFMQRVRLAARHRYAPEKQVHMALEGFRREVVVRDLCRRGGIRPGAFYAWTNDFMKAGKGRLTRDAIGDATRHETEQIEWENAEFKHLVADLSLEAYRLKRTAIPPLEDHAGVSA